MIDRIRQTLVVLLALGQLALPPLLFARGFTVDAARPPLDALVNPATPAGYAFGIWGVIYGGCLAYAIRQALPRFQEDRVFRAIGWWTIAGFALCLCWLIAARSGPFWLTAPIISAMLVALAIAASRAVLDQSSATGHRWFVAAPLALYAGWLTAATPVNITDVALGYGLLRHEVSAADAGLSVLVCIAGLAVVSGHLLRWHPAYAVALLWALLAIAARNGFRLSDIVVQACALVAALIVAALLFYRRKAISSAAAASS